MNWDAISRVLFWLSVMVALFVYGMYAGAKRAFPYKQLRSFTPLVEAFDLLASAQEDPWYFSKRSVQNPIQIYDTDGMMSGLTLVSTLTGEGDFWIKVIEPTGKVVTDWRFDIFSIWPDFSHLEPRDVPKKRPGSHIHGVLALEDGGIVFVVESIGLVRVNACGQVQWRLPYRAHHSIFRDDQGDFWTGGEISRRSLEGLPKNHRPAVQEMRIYRVSAQGELLDDISIFDIFNKNGLHGLLNLGTLENHEAMVTGDTLHLNDVEVFPNNLQPGVFQPGDVMISLRNINGVFVFDPKTWELRAHTIGRVLRQHDPDFIDSNRVAIFDNNTSGDPRFEMASRIAIWDARDGSVVTKWKGSGEQPFYTNIMGKQQWLENGNLLLVESAKGRVVEVGVDGRVVWEWNNVIAEDTLAIIDDAQRLPIHFNAEFYSTHRQNCGG